jgi:two-component system, NtrC family, nitrogen regulation response regulator GlnG
LVELKPASNATNSPLVLVVDDEPSICWAFERALQAEGHQVQSASSAEEGLELAERLQPSLILLDVRLPQEDGIAALPKFIVAAKRAAIVVMTAFGDLETAVAAVQNGASDYLTKPFKLEDALRVCRQGLHAAQSRIKPITPSASGQREVRLVGSSPAIQQAFKQIALVAGSELSVLITGETGTGKELVASAIHRHSQRAAQAYLPIAPVALNPDLIESELFGHVKGAFTGASDNRAGLFEMAEGGTVLLDEIGELPMSIQAKLLRVLEQGEYCRVGDVQPRRCNVRILAATNCDLREAVAKERFREDLFYRLNGLQIHLPPLRERTEDLPQLCSYFLHLLDYASADNLASALLDDLSQRPWYGNIRELKNALEHAAVVARGRPLEIADFPLPLPPTRANQIANASSDMPSLSIQSAASNQASSPLAGSVLHQPVRDWAEAVMQQADGQVTDLHERLLAAVEPPLLQFALRQSGGNRAKAAALLGLHRGTIREKLKAYQDDLADPPSPPGS